MELSSKAICIRLHHSSSTTACRSNPIRFHYTASTHLYICRNIALQYGIHAGCLTNYFYMTSINDPIRQASLFTSWGLIDPRFMADCVEKPLEEIKSVKTASTWWMKVRISDFFSSAKKTVNA